MYIIYKPYYAFSERLNYVVFKIDKIQSKHFLRKNTGNQKMKNSKTLKEFFFPCYCQKRFCRKKFLMAFLMRYDQKCLFWAFLPPNSRM